MSEVRLLVREADRDWSGTIHASCADAAIAALSADPVTLAELETAYARFAKPRANGRFLANLSLGDCDEPYDAGVVVIDLAARLVMVDSTYSSPGPKGSICYHNGHCATRTYLRYHLAEDWLFMSDLCSWPCIAEQRRRERAANPPLDAREMFYGRPLLEFIGKECFTAFARQTKIDEESTHDMLKRIHADWLLTPRDDLGGVCPRELAFERQEHLTWDLQDQCERWSKLSDCPPGLDESSFAFRYGGFGTHELVKYYDLVRELLWSCEERLVALQETHAADNGPDLLTVEAFLHGEVPRLESVRDEWFDTPDWECHGRTPRSIINRERARLPEGMSGQDAIIDPDCPCCQMMADMPGPVFWHLDGSEMDEDFAFDLTYRTREEWEEEQRRSEEFHQRFNAEWQERQRLGVTHASGEESVWSSSFSVGDADDVPLGIRLFGIGCHLAELITDLRSEPDGSMAPTVQRLIDQLNRDFGNLREILQTSEPSLALALFNPLMERFADSLSAVTFARPDLAAKCESLADCLTKILDPPTLESNWDSDDSDIPF